MHEEEQIEATIKPTESRKLQETTTEIEISESAFEIDAATALKEFLLDIECLSCLTEWTDRFNLFDVLKISRAEIRHSNMLAWLLDPNENHGLGDRVLRGFIHNVLKSSPNDIDLFEMLLMDYNDIIVQREWHNIDILAVSSNEKFVLCIENKIDSSEHDDQLNRYREELEKAFPAHKKKYIFLSPEGVVASDPENWYSMSYEDVKTIIESAYKSLTLSPEVQLLIKNYIDLLRRSIVEDKKIAQICAEIYAKHKKALDLIFEYRPDRASELADIIHAWASDMAEKGEIEYVPDKSFKTVTRFKTKYMSKLLPDAKEAKSGWGTKNYYFYEIRHNDGKEFYFQFAVSSKEIPADLWATCERINQVKPSRQQKEDWQWRTHFSSHHSKVDEELSREKIYEQLNKRFDEIRHFEQELQEKLFPTTE